MKSTKEINTDGGKYTEGSDHSTMITVNNISSKNKNTFLLPNKAPYNTKNLIGRESYIKDIVYSLEHERPYIITLTGIGGVGKSSIAYHVCEKLKTATSFEYIIWVSAKETFLTTNGIEAKDSDLKDLDGLMNRIVISTGLEKKEDFYNLDIGEKINTAYDYLSMAPFLLVIDNLETIKFDKQLSDFLEKIPVPSKVLITTRESKIVGEKIIGIKEMLEDESIELLKQEALYFGAREITNASLSQLKSLINKFGKIPLALSFLAALSGKKVSLGKIEQDIKNVNSTEIIDFCFSGLYKTLSEQEKKVFLSLIILPKVHRTNKIINLVNNSKEDIASSALNKLESISWISKEEIDNAGEVCEMLPLTQIFCQIELDKRVGLESEFRERYAKELTNQKVFQEARKQYEKSYIKLGAKSEQERLSVYLIQTALVLSERGNIKKATELINKAIASSPNFPYVYKMKASMQFRLGNLDEARKLYIKSYELGGKKFKPILKELALLEKEANNFMRMREYAEEFLKTNEDKRIYQLFAVSTSRDLKDFELADEYFKKALYQFPRYINEGHHNVTTYHAMATNYKNWATMEKNIDRTKKRELIAKAMDSCNMALKIEKSNMRLYELLEECKVILNNFQPYLS